MTQLTADKITEIFHARYVKRQISLDMEPDDRPLRGAGGDAVPVVLDLAVKTPGDAAHAAQALHDILPSLSRPEREEARNELLDHLDPGRDPRVRVAALEVLAKHYADDPVALNRVLGVAREPLVDASLSPRTPQVCALWRLAEMNVGRELLLLLVRKLSPVEIGAVERRELAKALFGCLKRHASKIRFDEIQPALSVFLTSDHEELRILAIDLFGYIGELDTIEYLAMLPLGPAERRQLQESATRILDRPRNLLSLRPEMFEHLIGHLYRKRGLVETRVTRFNNDGGVDIEGYEERDGPLRHGREKWLIQCKRYSPDHRVRREEVEEFYNACTAGQAKHGVLVTTSGFTKDATIFAEKYPVLELIDGDKLLADLKEYLPTGSYVIQSRKQIPDRRTPGPRSGGMVG